MPRSLGEITNDIKIGKVAKTFPEQVDIRPKRGHIEITTRCNLFCKQCARQTLKLPEPYDMPFDHFVKIFDQFPYMRKLSITGLSESLLNKDYFNMIRYAKSKQPIEIGSFSNGNILTDQMAENIIKSKVDNFNISTDAATKEVYGQIRIGGKVDKVLENVARLVQTRKRLNSKLPIIGLSMTLMKDNFGDAVKLVEIGKELGVDSVGFGDLNLDWSTELKELDRAKTNEIVAQVVQRAKELGIHIAYNLMEDRACDEPFLYPYITAKGFLTPCCWRPYDKVFNFGNLLETPFDQLWNSEKIKKFRRDLASGNVPGLCRGCVYTKKHLERNGIKPDFGSSAPSTTELPVIQ